MIYLLLILLFCGSALAQTPIDYNKWQHDDSSFSMQFGGQPQNYHNGSEWTAIQTNWESWGRGYKATRSRHNLYVDTLNDIFGFVIKDSLGNKHKLGTKIGPLFFFHKITKDTIRIADANLSGYSVSGDTVTIENVYPDVDCLILSRPGGVQYRFIFGAKADSAIDFKWDSAGANPNVFVVNTFQMIFDSLDANLYDRTGNIDTSVSHDIIGNLNFRALGKRLFGIQTSYVWQLDTPEATTVAKMYRRLHRFGSQIWYFEGYRVADVYDWPDGGYEHNLDEMWTATNITDTYVFSSYGSFEDNNYGVSVVMYVDSVSPGLKWPMLRVDVSSVSPTITVDSVNLMMMSYYKLNTTYELYKMVTQWDEGTEDAAIIDESGEHGATYNLAKDDYDAANWSWASGDFSGLDWDSLATGEYASDVSDGSDNTDEMYFSGEDLEDLVEGWINGSINNYGLFIMSIDGTIVTKDNGTSAYRPWMYIEYTESGEPADAYAGSIINITID